MSLAIVDLGCGNLGSVAIALERFGVAPLITADAGRIAAAERVVLPGVGAAGFAMERIETLGVGETLRSLRQPVLGARAHWRTGRVGRTRIRVRGHEPQHGTGGAPALDGSWSLETPGVPGPPG